MTELTSMLTSTVGASAHQNASLCFCGEEPREVGTQNENEEKEAELQELSVLY